MDKTKEIRVSMETALVLLKEQSSHAEGDEKRYVDNVVFQLENAIGYYETWFIHNGTA